jgi:preprotein translocase subunit YajC
LNVIEILAQTLPATNGAGTGSGGTPPPSALLMIQQLLPFILIGIVFYFLVIGSKRKQEKQRRDMLEQLKKGDRVQTIGGILGTVVEVRDGEVVVKVDENTNTKLRFSRSAIHRVTTEDDKAESK